MGIAVSTRSLSSQLRSPFAQRVLNFIRGFDPPLSQNEIARKIGVSPQAFNAWMQSKSVPREESVGRLAEVLGCSEAALQRDIDLSRNWVPPYEFDQFVGDALRAAQKENWPDRAGIEKYLLLGRAEMWRDQDSVWAIMTKDILSVRQLPLKERALRVAHLVRAWERLKDDPDLG